MEITPSRPPATTARTEAPEGDAAKVARDFEAVFLTQAMDQMMSTVSQGTFGGGHAEETWRSFLARAFAEEVADSGTTGIARSIEGTIGAYRARMEGNEG